MLSINILSTQRLTDPQIRAIREVEENANITICRLEEAENYIADTDILICWGSQDIAPLLPKAKRLKWVHTFSAGVDLLLPALSGTDILLTNSRGIHGIPIAEHVMGMMLNFTRGINVAYEQQKQKIWKNMSHLEELYESSIAIVGLGSIGREIAKRAKCMGMKVLATKRTITTELFVDKLYTADQLPQLLGAADFVVVTLPLTPQTKGLFRRELFESMKKSAYFINVARGAIVDETDLLAALQNGTIRGAALDVFENEPLTSDSPLWKAQNLFITPHVAAKSQYYFDRSLKIFTENLAKLSSKSDMLNLIDKEKGY